MGSSFPNFNEITRKNRPAKWGLDYYSPWDLKPDGTKKRVKEFFLTKEERATRRRDLEDRFAKLGASATLLPTTEELIDYRAMRAVLPANVTGAKAAKVYVANHRSSGMPLRVLEDSREKGFFEAYLDSMRARGLDPAWIKQVGATLTRFAASMPVGVGVGDVTKEDGRRWMDSLKAYSDESRNNFRRRVYGAFQWAVEEEMIESNPFDRVEAPEIRRGAPKFFTVPEARAILATTALYYPDYVRFVVLRFFVGMRRSQIRRLRESDIDIKKRKIDAPGWREVEEKGKTKMTRVTKSGDRHLIQDAPAALWAWLERYPVLNTANHLLKFRKIFKRAGVKAKKNAFRHSFATYFVNFHGNANLTMHILGQEEDSKAFFDHYRGFAEKEECEAFLALFPWAVLPSIEPAADFKPPGASEPSAA